MFAVQGREKLLDQDLCELSNAKLAREISPCRRSANERLTSGKRAREIFTEFTEVARGKPASERETGAPETRVRETRGSVREGSSKDAIDSCEREAAPRRHNITILERPPRARGGRRHGREAGLTPSCCDLVGR